MGIYRVSRSIEASIIFFLIDKLEDSGWMKIRVIKSFAAVYKEPLPCILVEQVDSSEKKLEIGGNNYIELHTINIRIFAKEDGSRLDLKDWLFDTIKNGLNYYEYTITNGEVETTLLKGRININRIISNRKDIVNTEGLHDFDKHRHLLSVECKIALS